MELQQLKKALADRAENVCSLLLPGGKVTGGEWCCGDIGGSAGQSLKVVLRGDKAGIWRDFSGDLGGSNLLELWVQAKNLPFQEALSQARQWLQSQGVGNSASIQAARQKTYSKPTKKGITYIASKVEFYMTAERFLPKEIVDLYKISMLDSGDVIVFPFLSEHGPEHAAQMIKYLKLERDENGKKIPWTSKDTPKVLFGKHTVKPTDRYLLISEGEIDGMTWATQKIKDLCCTSVPFGAKWEGKDGKDPNDEWIENDWDFLSRFERIYLSFDMDDAGRRAAMSIIKRLGREVCFVINLPEKDSNFMRQQGRDAELVKAFAEAKTLDPETLKNANDFRQSVLDRMFSDDANVRKGIALPFGNYPFHLRWNEWTVVTGLNGSGKTQLIDYILLNLKKLGYPSCIASLEVPVSQTLTFMVGQTLGTNKPERPLAEAALDWLAGGFWFYDHVGKADWRDIITTWRYAYRRHGVRFFVLDSWMKIGIAGDDLDAQGVVCTAISDFVRDCDVHVFIVAHPRKLKNEDEIVGKMDIKGSGELTDQAHNVWLVFRNKKKEKQIEQMIKMKDDEAKISAARRAKPDAQLIIGKQRNGDGDEPTIDLWYLKESKQFFGHYRFNSFSFLEEQKAPDEPPLIPAGDEIDEDAPF
jgi:twinkle protein